MIFHTVMRTITVASCFAIGIATAAGVAVTAAEPGGHESPAAFYIAPNGNDTWSGTLREPNAQRTDGPFATLGRAQEAARSSRHEPGSTVGVTVRIRGTHRLSRPMVFTHNDSGTAESPVIYTTYSGETAVLSGGRIVTGWQRTDGPLWTVRLPEVQTGNWYFRQLFVNGRRAKRAGSPNQGYFHVESLVDEPAGVRWNVGVDKFRFKPGDIKSWSDLGNVEVVVYHSWNTSRVRIASVDEPNRTVTFTGPTVFRPLAWDPEQRYCVENARELLDSPGEWYLHQDSGTLYYWPLPGEDMTTAEVVAPVLGELLRFEGDADSGKFVDHIHVIGLSLQHADWTLAEKGYGDPQAAVTIPAAVMADGARNCRIEQCEVAHVGTYGIWFRRGCKDNRIVQNHIHDLGAGGVRIGEPAMAANDTAESSRNLVSNNYIHDGGHVYPAGVGFWLAHSSDNTISHNEIHSFNYSGMSIGWNWNDAPTRTLRNTIEQNHVHHVVRGILSDAGGIYTLGTQTGTVIRNNVFHDVWPYMGQPAMAWGIYFDATSNGLLVENNVVYNTLTGGIMNTGSPGNIVRNNIFALSARHAAWRYTWQKEPASIVERNIFYVTQGELFHNDGGRGDFRSKWNRNLYWRADGKSPRFYGGTFEQWQAKGMEQEGLVANPQFVDAAGYDFRLQPDSPALRLGFQPIDTSHVGVCEPAAWRQLPRRTEFPPTVLPPLPPPPKPVPLDDGFETTAVGEPPALATVYEEGAGDSIRVTDETAATGRRSLKFVDASGLKHVFDPHMFYAPHFREGRATLSFDLRLEKGAVFAHEWRDASQPYHVGPSFVIHADGRLMAGGKYFMDVPIGTWFHADIVCGLGGQAEETYDLKITVPGKPTRVFDSLPCGVKPFENLEWLGFVSLASEKTAFYLDNVELKYADAGDH